MSVQKLAELSRFYGSDIKYVIAGGGNTSFKDGQHLWVKASGHALATITEEGFAQLDRSRLNAMAEKNYSSDAAEREEQVKNRSEEHTSELQSRPHLVCRLLLEKKKRTQSQKKSHIGYIN